MTTHQLRFVVGGMLAVLVLGFSQGCVGPQARHGDHRPREIRPRGKRLLEPQNVPIIVMQRSTPPESRGKRKGGPRLTSTSVDVDFSVTWPSGLSSPATMAVKCYEAVMVDDSGTYYVYSDGPALPVFGSSTSASITLSSSDPTDSVAVDLSNQSGNYFFIAAGTDVPSGATTYSFLGGTLLTKP